MKKLCIIPARGGSKRIPRKNILPLNGTPLMAYSIKAALESDLFDEVIVSTEDAEIKELALNYGAKVDDRPKEMAGDTVTKVQVVLEFLGREENQGKYNVICALLPTCPFRTSNHLREAFETFTANPDLPFLIGVTEYEFPIQLALTETEGAKMQMTFPEGYMTTRSQNIAKRFHPNGAMYIANVDAFMEKGTFFNEEMLTYKMDALSSYDIDYPYQFEIAEILAKKIQNNEL